MPVGQGPDFWDRLFWAAWNPHILWSWILISVALWHLFVSKRRGLALHLLIAAWYVTLILDVIALERLIHSFVFPTGTCGLFSARDALMSFQGTYLVLAAVTLPLALVARRSRAAALPVPATLLGLSIAQVTCLLHLALWWLATPFGQWPSIAGYLRMLQ